MDEEEDLKRLLNEKGLVVMVVVEEGGGVELMATLAVGRIFSLPK